MNNNINDFAMWIINNPNEFQKMSPEMDAELRKTVKKIDKENPFEIANIIHLIVDDFSEMIEKADKMLGNRKKEEYIGMKRLFENLLSYDMGDNIVAKITRDNNKQNLLDYIKHIDEKLINIDKEQNTNLSQRGFDLGLTEEQLKSLPDELKNKNLSGKKIPSPAEQITFEQLFKDKSDVGKILGYLDEYISDRGEWICKPQVRCLVALCMVLEKKGYFLNTWTNPIKAQALSLKFGVPCTPKSFQASERGKSEYLIELFNIIPTKIIS